MALVSNRLFPQAIIPAVDMNDVTAIADMVYRRALPLTAVLAALERSGSNGPTV